MIIGLQAVAIVFALIMVYFSYLHYSRGELNGLEILSWTLIWVVTIVIVVFPELLRTFARTFSVTRVFDLMVVGGFILVISIVYMAYVRTRRLEKKMEDLIRFDALGNAKSRTPQKK